MKTVEKRFEVEKWRKKNNISVMVLTETHAETTHQEKRKNYTWYFGGREEENTKGPFWQGGLGSR